MKNILIAGAFILIAVSCSIPKTKSVNSGEEDFVLAYKKSVLFGCIDESTSNKFNTFLKENNDLGLAIEVEIIQHQETLNAIIEGRELSKKIKPIIYADFEGKKPNYSECINFAFSEEIDSIARKIYRKKQN